MNPFMPTKSTGGIPTRIPKPIAPRALTALLANIIKNKSKGLIVSKGPSKSPSSCHSPKKISKGAAIPSTMATAKITVAAMRLLVKTFLSNCPN